MFDSGKFFMPGHEIFNFDHYCDRYVSPLCGEEFYLIYCACLSGPGCSKVLIRVTVN